MAGLKLMAELGLDGAGFASGMHRARGLAQGVAEGLKSFAVQAIGITAVEQAISKTVETARELVEQSERLGIAPEKLQVLRQAAKDSGMEMTKLAEVMEKIDLARQKALTPGSEGADSRRAFKAAGIGQDQLKSKTAADLLLGPLRDAVKNASPETVGVIFRELGVKGFGQLIPLLKTNFDELGEKMHAVGAIMDTETAVKLKHLSDEFSLIGQIITSQLGPGLLKLVEVIYQSILKLGGKVAGASAFYGAGTAGKGVLGTAGTLLKTAGLGAAHLVGAISTEELKKRMSGMGFDLPGAQKAGAVAQGPWQARLEQFASTLDKMRKEANELDHPKPANFSAPTIAPKIPKKALEEPTDNLVRIGNFLGSGKVTVNRLAEKRTELLAKIEQHLRRRGGPQSARGLTDGNSTFIPIA